MLSTDREEFEVQMALLCAGFNVPLGDRVEAYWKGVAKMSLLEFARTVEYALGEEGPEKIPSTAQLWAIKKKMRSVGAIAVPTMDADGKALPTIQEQLCEYAAQHTHDLAGPVGMTLLEYSRPWVYVYREWRDEKANQCAECIGIVIELDTGKRLGWSVKAMLEDRDGHARALRAFKPGPKPTVKQMAVWHMAADVLRDKVITA